MTNAITKGLGCMFLLAFPTAIVAAIVIAVAHGGRGAYLTTALAGAVALFAVAGYVVVKAWLFVRGRGGMAARAPVAAPRPMNHGMCSACKERPATCFCVLHATMLCAWCAQSHHTAGQCYYTAFLRSPERTEKAS